MNEIILMILSCARLLATAGIFIYHILGMAHLNNRHIDFISILIFCFLSGFFGIKVKLNPQKWIIKRIFSIMIPYWFVIIPALIINRIIHYKKTTLFMDIITALGGNLFLDNPVYVIAWYITFVLILYLFLYIQSHNFFPKIFTWCLGYFVISHLAHNYYYFLAFSLGYSLSGYLLSKKISISPNSNESQTKIGLFLFTLQRYCYPFFLVHGGILVLLYYELNLSIFYSIFFGFIISCLLSFLLVQITNPIITQIVNKTWQYIPFSLLPIGRLSTKNF